MSTRVAVVLAAGVGSRLRPLTNDRPKALVDLGGETILSRAVRLLASRGVEEVVVASGYREDALRGALAGAPVRAYFCRNPRYETTQNSVSLALCAERVAGRAFFKLDGDVVFEPVVLDRLDAVPEDLAVAVDSRGALDEEAMKVSAVDGRITAFGKGIRADAAAGESIGIERLSERASASVFSALERAIAAGRTDLYYEDVYSELLRDELGARLVDVCDLRWAEIDDHDDLARARRLLS